MHIFSGLYDEIMNHQHKYKSMNYLTVSILDALFLNIHREYLFIGSVLSILTITLVA